MANGILGALFNPLRNEVSSLIEELGRRPVDTLDRLVAGTGHKVAVTERLQALAVGAAHLLVGITKADQTLTDFILRHRGD